MNVNPKVDVIFKKLFGSEENKDLLLSLINAVLPPNEQITDLTLRNPYNLAAYKEGKLSILDIKAVAADGRLFDIELQVTPYLGFGQRALFYWGKVFTDQLGEGQTYSMLHKVIVISLLDYHFFADQQFFRVVQLRDRDTGERYPQLDFLELFFVEMNKFTKDFPQVKTALDRWVSFMTHACRLEAGKLPKELASDPAVDRAVSTLARMYLEGDEREWYETERKALLTRMDELICARKEGLAEGEAKGLAEGQAKGLAEGQAKGRAEGQAAAVRQMREGGMSPTQIAAVMRLPLDQVAAMLGPGYAAIRNETEVKPG
jgi:predicted transposase/invertase (TIGR01784 family)